MRRMSFQAVSPAGLVIDAVTVEGDRLLIAAHPSSLEAVCPECGRRSGQVHSRYDRRLMDVPSHGRAVHLHVGVRRFRCGNASCPRVTFGEPLVEVASPAARRTSRLEGIVHHLGIAPGGRPAASLACRLMLPVSRDTLLRVVRRRAPLTGALPVTAIGIADFAWKRGQRYGTLVCDLEQRRIIDLLPDRDPATVEAWLAAHLEITVVSRDRGGGYGQAASNAAPQAVQVADRWHLMENASAAFLEAVRRSMRSIREVLSATVIARRAVAATWCAVCCVTAMARCSVAGATSWLRITSGSGPSGTADAEMAPSCGAGFAPPVSVAAFALWRSEQPGKDATRKLGWRCPAPLHLQDC